jgi:NitT/TauT family transport system ATP-binding protein
MTTSQRSGPDDTLIDVEGLSMVYQADSEEERVRALDGIDLSVKKGEFLSVVGPSGCGKTTLLRIMSGLLIPTEGAVKVRGEPLDGPISDIGFVFQEPVLLDWKTVFENCMFSYRALASNDALDHDRAHYEERTDALLEMVGIEEFTDSYPYQLSGGMQQRAAIVRALVTDPSVLLMDEPFGALDEFTRDRLNKELLDIHNETQKTILFITHNIQEAVYLSDRVLVMSPRPGQIRSLIEIDLDRPRPLSVRDGDQFREYVTELREEIGIYAD